MIEGTNSEVEELGRIPLASGNTWNSEIQLSITESEIAKDSE